MATATNVALHRDILALREAVRYMAEVLQEDEHRLYAEAVQPG